MHLVRCLRRGSLTQIWSTNTAEENPARPPNHGHNQTRKGKQMILIVDDQRDSGVVLERLLQHAGHEALSVTGGAEAIATLHIRKPSLMILDVRMPEMDGMTVLRTIREHDEWEDVRVVMFSAEPLCATMIEAKRLGAVDFLVKGSISFTTLLARIDELAGEPSKLH